MAGSFVNALSQPGFDAESYVNKMSQGGEDKLDGVHKEVQRMADETAVALKKNVYKNYSQFIETAKEISILEGEMYQLSHMLTDQKSIMNGLLEMSITGDTGQGHEDIEESTREDDNQKNLAFLLEKVEGCSSVTEVPGRFLIHDGDLIEMDPESFTQIHKVHAFLLNDSLMMATWLPQRRGPVKYRFQALYELDNLAVVNARDVGDCKNAFKVLMFPDTRMFMAETPKAKRQWLDILEETKKKKAAADNLRKEAAAAAAQDRLSSSSYTNNPFFEEDDSSKEQQRSSLLQSEFLHVPWVQELPEDLDVYIAQRDFEGAVDLVEKVNEYLSECPKDPAVREYRARIEQRIKQLTEVLMHELQVSPEKSIRGGPRAARRAVTQLIRLGKSAQACDLFLKNRGSIVRYNMRQLKIEGNTALYVKRLCEVFFTSLKETGVEFIKAFPEHFGCFSTFVVWTKAELLYFVNMFGSQIFVNKTNFSIVSDCVYEARTCCDQLNEIGLELTFALDRMMANDLSRLIQEAGDNRMEAVKLRHIDSSWRPTNFGNTATCDSFEREMCSYGIKDIHNYTQDDCFTELSENTIQFTKSHIQFCSDLMKLYSQEHHDLVTGALIEIFKAQISFAEKSAAKESSKKEIAYIIKNVQFLVNSLLPVIKGVYENKTGHSCLEFDAFPTILRKIKKYA